MAFGDFVDDSVGAQEAELAADLGGQALVIVISVTRIEQSSEVAIAESGGREFAASNGLEERQVGGVADAKGSYATTVVSDGGRDAVEKFTQAGGVVDRGERIEVAFVGALGNQGAAVKIGDALSQRRQASF